MRPHAIKPRAPTAQGLRQSWQANRSRSPMDASSLSLMLLLSGDRSELGNYLRFYGHPINA
jgi:hypothetical protein